jgi:hypothetical protein
VAGGREISLTDPRNSWLTEITKMGRYEKPLQVMQFEPGSDRESLHNTGEVDHICNVSATLCYRFQKQAMEVEGPAAGKSTSVISIPKFPERAAWLKQRLQERNWNKHDVLCHWGPDQKTVQKILDGDGVREDVLEKLATALSDVQPFRKLPAVNLLDIPQN